MLTEISVRGAREHNLKSVDVDIPRDKLVVITGLSGSGKSSLAFDTIYAEGQRRYVESLSAYARQFLEMMQKPDVDHIEGLSPAISIEQKTTSKNPRSTVGTVTEIYDYMRLLWARVGIPYSPTTGLPIESQTVSQMVDRIMALGDGTRIYLLSPIVRGRKGEYRKEFADLQKQGFQRVKVDGEFYLIEDAPTLDKKFKHDIDVVVDRIVLKDGIQQRLAESVETALGLSDGLLVAEIANKGDAASTDADAERHLMSAKFACPVSGFTIEEIEPRLFSFNNPFGACPNCDGLGKKLHFSPELMVPDTSKTIRQGALAPWANKSNSPSPFYFQALEAVGRHFDVDLDTPWEKLPQKACDAFLNGTGKQSITIIYADGKRRFEVNKPFEGVLHNVERRWRETDSNWMRDELSKYQTSAKCTKCQGNRLKPEALAVKIDGEHVSNITGLSIRHAYDWFNDLPKKLNSKQGAIAEKVLKEIQDRLGFLLSVGLEYLSLIRSSGTLSGGESQRIRLASQIGSGLTGVLYVLDEPSIGLHQRDNDKLLETLQNLRDIGNTVLVVEHDKDAIRTADYVIDMGPGAGEHGGMIVAQGTAEEVMAHPDSLTGQYMTGKRAVPIPATRRPGKKGKFLTVKGATANNLKNVEGSIPLGTLTCITGVSGSGKSTFTIETLYKAVAKHLNGSRTVPGAHTEITGLEHLDKIVDIDQSPIGRTPRSNPATYTGAFTPIREWFAGLPESQARGYKSGRFSFNVKGGRCEACKGDGLIKIEMHFLPDVYVQCDQCKGKRYNRETLEIQYRGKSIADVLDMTVEEGAQFFKAVPTIRIKMDMLEKVGLSYIHVGQQATTLSGGEAQRVKLAKELSKRSTGKTLYILDEPTTGLHFEDVRKLMEVLQALVEQGNTVIVIEHNLEVIKTADWILDLGPEGGDGGGEIVAVGTPEDVANNKKSYTGHYLSGILKRQAAE
ncbi:MAG: excinuclease ABC subunit UvrA [Kordiimonadaceae bacterium]|nr:excinuclease ABC subunit UvrA [Kordiimonadaceae bacterium]